MNAERLLITILIILVTAMAVQFIRTGGIEQIVEIKQRVPEETFSKATTEIPGGYKKALVIYSDEDNKTDSVYYNVKEAFKLGKITHEETEVKNGRIAGQIGRLKADDIVIIATENYIGELFEAAIEKYVRRGGNIVFLLRGFSPKLEKIIGIKRNHGYAQDLGHGIKFLKDVFPGMDNMERKKGVHSYLKIELKKDCSVIAVTNDGNAPIIWERNTGKGKIIFVNSTMFQDRLNRGLMLQLIMRAATYSVSSIANIKMVHIDDFPAPVKRGRDKIVFNQYGVNNEYFYRNIWWPDMYNFSKRFNIKYTGFIIGQYNLNTTGKLPEISKTDMYDLKYFGRKLAHVEGEIGIHGYNHNSLALKDEIDFEDFGYYPWESPDKMKDGLIKLKESVRKLYGNIHMNAYVAPSNMISAAGKRAVKDVFEDIKIFSGIFMGDDTKGLMMQDIGEDKDIPGTYDMPRMSAGYIKDEDTLWNIYNGIGMYGYISHFVHPDDIFSYERSGENTWKELYENINKMFSKVGEYYAFIEPMTISEAYSEIIKNKDMSFYTYKKDDIITIKYKNAVFPECHFVRINEGKIISRVEGGEFFLIKNEGKSRLYMLKTKKTTAEIILRKTADSGRLETKEK